MHSRWHPGLGRGPTGPEELLVPAYSGCSQAFSAQRAMPSPCLVAHLLPGEETNTSLRHSSHLTWAVAVLLRVLGLAAPPSSAGSGALCTDGLGRLRTHTPSHRLPTDFRFFLSISVSFFYFLSSCSLLCSSARLFPFVMRTFSRSRESRPRPCAWSVVTATHPLPPPLLTFRSHPHHPD